MIFSCKCLNIVVRVSRDRVDGREKPTISSLFSVPLDNSIGAEQIAFFDQALGPVDEVIAITRTQSALIQCLAVQDWDTNRCINCKDIVYACNEIHKSYLMNAACRTTAEEMDKIRASTVYSPVFQIAMVASEFTGNLTDLKISERVKTRVKDLEWNMNHALLTEATAAEERIRIFSEQQYSASRMYRLRAEQELYTLFNVINGVPEIATGGGQSPTDHGPNTKTLMETPPATPDNTPMSIGNSPPLAYKLSQKIPNKEKNSTNKSSNHSNVHGGNGISSSIDSEGIFDLDGDLMSRSKSPISNEDSDIDESDHEVIPVRRPKGGHGGVQIPRTNRQLTIAKSLPISMPIAKQSTVFTTTEDDFDELPEDNNVDIAASIKALARSVHGDAIFGDLPRPRRPKFTTDI